MSEDENTSNNTNRLNKRLKILQDNLHTLKDQNASYGSLNAPINIINQIRQTELEIQQLKSEIEQSTKLDKSGKSLVQGNESASVNDELISKLLEIKRLNSCPYALVGSTYIDVTLSPINTQVLERSEWSNIGPLKFHLGGSAYWVGFFLWKLHNIKSYLFSSKGTHSDPLTKEFDRLLQKEPWLIDKFCTYKDLPSPVTVHLIQDKNLFETMFTSANALHNLSFMSISNDLNEVLADGGVLYISGYFKTNLSNDLDDVLKQLRSDKNTLVCIDHGLLMADEMVGPARKLKAAFEGGLVDIYFCTLDEIWDLFNAGSKNTISKPNNDNDVISILETLPHDLGPYITVLRDIRLPYNKVFTKVRGSTWNSIKGTNSFIVKNRIGIKNAFNAEFIYSLIHNVEENKDLNDFIEYISMKSFNTWLTRSKNS
jgi:hypothetical protein